MNMPIGFEAYKSREMYIKLVEGKYKNVFVCSDRHRADGLSVKAVDDAFRSTFGWVRLYVVRYKDLHHSWNIHQYWSNMFQGTYKLNLAGQVF